VFRQRSKPHAFAMFNNRFTRTSNVDIYVLALVHSELAGAGNYNTVLHVCDVCCSLHRPSQNQRINDVSNIHGGELCILQSVIFPGHGDVYYAMLHIADGASRHSEGGGDGEYDVHILVAIEVNVGCL
jgi:hypothetical protein